jgi:Ras-related protein Rab-2A
LDNSELFSLTFGALGSNAEHEELLSRLDYLSGTGEGDESDIKFLASHFYEFSESELDSLSFYVAEAVVSDPGLVLEKREDELFEFISRRASDDSRFLSLLEFVRFDYLSDGNRRSAMTSLTDSFEFFTLGVWKNLSSEMLGSSERKPEEGRYHRRPSEEGTKQSSGDASGAPSESAQPPLYRIVLVGAPAAGRSAILRRLVDDQFSESMLATVGVEFRNFPIASETGNARLQIWDTTGNERYRSISRAYLSRSDGIFLVFDVKSREGFERIDEWREAIEEGASNAIVFLIGNKSDAESDRQVSSAEAQAYAAQHHFEYFETSAKTGAGIQEAFARMAEQIGQKKGR